MRLFTKTEILLWVGILILVCILWMVFLNSVVSACTKFSPLSIPNYSIKLPKGAYVDQKDLVPACVPRICPTDNTITMHLYKYPDRSYYDKNTREEIYPYMELVKDGNTLLMLSFINKNLEVESYGNEVVYGGPNIDRMIKEEVRPRNIEVRKIK